MHGRVKHSYRGRDHMGHTDITGTVISNWILRKWDMRAGIGFDLRRSMSSEHGNEPSDSIRDEKVLDHCRYQWLLKQSEY